MNKLFYIYWENEYSNIEIFPVNNLPIESPVYSGPFKSLSEAKKVLISFLEQKIEDTRKNLQEIRALKPGSYEEEKDDL